MCVCSLRPMRKYIFINVDYQQEQDTACVVLMWVQRRRHWSGIEPATPSLPRLRTYS